jgi:predicted DNA binding CopG/RHH family protein
MAEKTMKKKKKAIPPFKTLVQETEFWDHHSPLDYDFQPASVEFSSKLKKRLISIRVHESLLKAVKRLAAQQHIPYQTLIHSLLEKTIRRELRKAA